jgi:hypothetical protein
VHDEEGVCGGGAQRERSWSDDLQLGRPTRMATGVATDKGGARGRRHAWGGRWAQERTYNFT